MAILRVCFAVALILLGGGFNAWAEDAPDAPEGLYDRPVLVVDPGMHTAPINGASADWEGRFAVTGSDDKTVRVWSLSDGRLLRTIRLPAGPGDVGKVYAVSINPDGSLIAAGGCTSTKPAKSRSTCLTAKAGR
jgi:WD40 repeat protein